MTTPSAPAAPIPADTSQSLDLTRPAAAQPPSAVQGAAAQARQWTGKLRVAPPGNPDNAVEYELMPSLSALDMCLLQEAQDSGKFREIITAIGQLVPKSQREHIVALMLSDPDDPRDRFTLEACMEVLTDGMEQIAARPTAS